MATVSKRKRKPAGSAPGSVVYVGSEKNSPVTISRLAYNSAGYEPAREVTAAECRPPGDGEGIVWYTVDGVHDVEALKTIGDNFGLHPLVLEDISNTTQRPKIEAFEGYVFIASKMMSSDGRVAKVKSEHTSIIYGKNFVILFLEDPGDLFQPVRQRIEAGKGRIRRYGPDYLVYALLDATIDYYFNVIEAVGERIERLEDEVVNKPTAATLSGIHKVKREIISLRRTVWPMREVVNGMVRDDSPFITDETRIFLRDLYDHTLHVIDSIETLRDIITGTLDVYLSSISHRLNEVMKVLTVMSSIFIPLTFIVGVYGMNFKYMPELEWVWGYPAVWITMVTLSVGLLAFFRRRNWL